MVNGCVHGVISRFQWTARTFVPCFAQQGMGRSSTPHCRNFVSLVLTDLPTTDCCGRRKNNESRLLLRHLPSHRHPPPTPILNPSCNRRRLPLPEHGPIAIAQSAVDCQGVEVVAPYSSTVCTSQIFRENYAQLAASRGNLTSSCNQNQLDPATQHAFHANFVEPVRTSSVHTATLPRSVPCVGASTRVHPTTFHSTCALNARRRWPLSTPIQRKDRKQPTYVSQRKTSERDGPIYSKIKEKKRFIYHFLCLISFV